MNGRRTLFGLATSLLYLGPVLAGAFGHGAGALAAFVLIFMLWLIVMRPVQFQARTPAGIAAKAAMTLLVQVALVAICWGIGGLLSDLVDGTPSLVWPLALSALSIPLARLSRAPDTGEMDEFVDQATEKLERMAQEIEDEPPNPRRAPDAEGHAVIDAAMDLLDGHAVSAVSLQFMDRVSALLTDTDLAQACIGRLRRLPDPTDAQLLADVTLSLRRDVIEAENFDGQAEPVMRALTRDAPDLIRATTQVILRLIEADEAMAVHADLPDDTALLTRAAALERDAEHLAHDIRAVVKTRAFAEQSYFEPTEGAGNDR